mmetsp:Transcript_100708/g.285407  ORF Transcript_100708/g.285407 Transcript_100708/m.285407 type:complete len:293 (-) Transcript_100708:437-1315(-)
MSAQRLPRHRQQQLPRQRVLQNTLRLQVVDGLVLCGPIFSCRLGGHVQLSFQRRRLQRGAHLASDVVDIGIGGVLRPVSLLRRRQQLLIQSLIERPRVAGHVHQITRVILNAVRGRSGARASRAICSVAVAGLRRRRLRELSRHVLHGPIEVARLDGALQQRASARSSGRPGMWLGPAVGLLIAPRVRHSACCRSQALTAAEAGLPRRRGLPRARCSEAARALARALRRHARVDRREGRVAPRRPLPQLGGVSLHALADELVRIFGPCLDDVLQHGLHKLKQAMTFKVVPRR